MKPEDPNPPARHEPDIPTPPPGNTSSTGTTSTGVVIRHPTGDIHEENPTIVEQTRLGDLLNAINAMASRFERRFVELEEHAFARRQQGSEEEIAVSSEDDLYIPTSETPLRGIGSVRFPETRRQSNISAGLAQTPCTQGEEHGMETPIMGVRLSESCVLVGGKPRSDWSALDGESISTPNCRRFLPGTSAEERAYKERCTAPEDFKLTKKCDIYDMMSLLTTHVKTHGLDTVLYVPDPDDETRVLFVPQHYSRLSYLLHKEKVQAWTSLWDNYDKENDAALVALLRSAIDKDIRTAINPYLDYEVLPASVILMLICNEIKPTTVLSYDADRANLMRKNVKSYTGHDVKKFCEVVRPELRRLKQAHELTKNVLIWLVNSFIAVNLMGFSDVIRQQFFDPLIETLASLGDYTQSQLMRTLRSKSIHWEQLLDRATLIYVNMKEAGHWKWTENKDSKASPQQFYLNELSDVPQTQKLVANIIAASKGGKPVCYKCGRVGYKVTDCPNCQKTKEPAATSTGASPKDPSSHSNSKKNQGIDHPAPKDGEKPIKVVDNRIYFWCPKCNRWESTHFPKNHGKEGTKLSIKELKKIKQDFVSDGTIPTEFHFCEIISSEGINL